ncbi:MAG: Asp/Glu/hydantoin racemase [Clostridiales bacterium]|nr:Asp/Glu/hydantoin racemase [Clostridiales bacterium]
MENKLTGKTLGIIHAAVFTANTVAPFCKEIIPEVEVMHFGDDTVQRDNLKAPVGTIPKVNFFKFTTYCHFLEEAKVDLIMLGCSTFNQAAELARPMINTPILNIDRPMMDLAVQQGKVIGLLGTLPSTMPASERLLLQAGKDAGINDLIVKPVLCAEAFKVLQEGNPKKHNEMLLEAIEELSKETDAIVMAQVSMSVLEKELTNTKVPVYNSGRTGFERAREMLLQMP